MFSRAAPFTALALGDASVLLDVRPQWQVVGTGLIRPKAWLDAAGPDIALAALCGVLLWIAAAWIALGLAAGLGARMPGAAGRGCMRFARAVLPKLLLRALLGSTGLALLAAPAAQALTPAGVAAAISSRAPASDVRNNPGVPTPSWPVTPPAAAPHTTAPHTTAPHTTAPHTTAPQTTTPSTPTRLPSPTPPTSGTATHPTKRSATPPAAAGAHVHPGDSLWLLAAHRLGQHASAGDVARYWPQIYAANRSVIGDDPSVIHPGQVIDLPTPTQESSR